MQEYAQKPEQSSSENNSRSSGQPPISEILQAYKNGTLQRMSVDEEELLQAKTRDKSSERETLQRYIEYTHRDKSRYNSFIQGMFDTTQRKGIEDEEPLQGKFDSSSAASESPVQRVVKPNNTGLPDNLKSGIENLSGYSLDDVRVHYNSDKPAQLSALAYAQGTDIHVAPGQERHLPHEAWHVVQQKQGRVQPTMQMQGVSVNDNEGLEKEADRMANLLYTPSPVILCKRLPRNIHAPIQMKIARAGVELQCGGVYIADDLDQYLRKGHPICIIGSGSKIEVDNGDIEYVSKDFGSSHELFTDIEQARLELQYMINLTYGASSARSSDTLGSAEQPAKYNIGTEKYTLRPKNRTTKWLAKPQITFQIGKGKLNDFVSKLTDNSVKYETSPLAREIYSRSIINEIRQGFDVIDRSPVTDESARALAKLAWQMVICAKYPTLHYYKARFSIMPRTSLKDTYLGMNKIQQTNFVTIIAALTPCLAGIELKNWVFDASYITDHEANKQTIKAITALESIYKQASEFSEVSDRAKKLNEKAKKSGGFKQVDALSSDTMASDSEVGNSVGAYDLPSGADSIIEIREGIPNVSINDRERVEKVYDGVLKHYSGETERANYIGT